MFRCALSHGLTLFPCRATCRYVAWRLDSKPWGNGPKLEGLAWRHFLSRMARMAIPKFHALHQIQKAITLRSLRWKRRKKQETSQRQEFKGFIGFIGLNTSRKSWKSSSWWGAFRTKHSTFGLFIRLGELNDDHDLQYSRNKIHWWTRKICMKIHIRNSWMSRSRPPQWASHHERTCDARHADLHIAITQCCPNQLTFVQLLASSWNEMLANGDCQFEFNWVRLSSTGSPDAKTVMNQRSSSSVILWSKLAKAPPAVV